MTILSQPNVFNNVGLLSISPNMTVYHYHITSHLFGIKT